MITFIVYHTDLSQKTQDKILDRVHTFTTCDHSQYINILFQSARLFHPACHFIILTDPTSSFNVDPAIQIIRLNVDARAPALNRLSAQILLLDHYQEESDLVFLDYDMLVNGELTSLFDGTFDIALTYRTDHNMVFNGGFIAVSSQRKAIVSQFLKQILNVLITDFPNFAIWWGFQKALDKYVGHDLVIQSKSDIILSGETKIKRLPTNIYNFSPKSEAQALNQQLMTGKKIIHFKGLRKVFMLEYWNLLKK